MLFTDNLEEMILYKPARLIEQGCNSLKIVTGFTDCDCMQRHFIALQDGINENKYRKKINIEIILGMTKGLGLSRKKHYNITKTLSRLPSGVNAKCNYIYNGQEVHSKVYVWCKNDVPIIAYCGSANYSTNAFQKRRECMSECNAYDALAYYALLLNDSVDCFDPSVNSKISFSSTTELKTEIDEDNIENLSYDDYRNKIPLDILDVSLLTKNDDVGYGSGINWGIRPNGTKRDRDQAYIPYNKKDRKNGFFPEKNNPDEKNNPLFKVVTDNDAFYMRLAQQGNKALHSAESNAIIGKWIRDKIGVPSGTFVTKEMLQDYGATSVRFKKFENGVYTLDFNPEAKEYTYNNYGYDAVAQK